MTWYLVGSLIILAMIDGPMSILLPPTNQFASTTSP